MLTTSSHFADFYCSGLLWFVCLLWLVFHVPKHPRERKIFSFCSTDWMLLCLPLEKTTHARPPPGLKLTASFRKLQVWVNVFNVIVNAHSWICWGGEKSNKRTVGEKKLKMLPVCSAGILGHMFCVSSSVCMTYSSDTLPFIGFGCLESVDCGNSTQIHK